MTREKGNRVYLCTGRSRAEIYQEIWDIGVDGLIGGNGSYIEASEKVLFENTLTLRQCSDIVDYLHSHHLEFYLEANSGLYASEDFEEVARATMIEYSGRKGHADASEMTVRKAFPEMLFGEKLYRSDVNKISYVLSSYQDYLDMKQAFPELKNGTWGGAGGTALFGSLVYLMFPRRRHWTSFWNMKVFQQMTHSPLAMGPLTLKC